MAKIGYARVSSIGQSLEIQLDKLTAAGCERIYREKLSGTKKSRPEYKACMNYLREGDTLVITRLDRLARSVHELVNISERFEVEGIHLHVLDQHIDTSTPTGKLTFTLLAAIAEFETQLRAERQREGIEKATCNGVKFGRPKLSDYAKEELIRLERAQGKTIGELVKTHKLGRTTIYRILKTSQDAAAAE